MWTQDKTKTTGERYARAQETLRSRWRAGVLGASGTATCATLLAVWLTPWIPVGLGHGDLTYNVWVAIVLAAGTALFGSVTVLTRQRLSGEGDVVALLRNMIGLDRHRRICTARQFRHALKKAWLRAAEDRRSGLSVILVRVGYEDATSNDIRPALDHAGEAVVPFVRLADSVGLVSTDEVGVVAVGADAVARRRITSRLERALGVACDAWEQQTARSGKLLVEVGGSSLEDGDGPDALLDAARANLRQIQPQMRWRERSNADLQAAA